MSGRVGSFGRDDGAGGVVGVGVVVALCVLMCAMLPMGGALAAQQRLRGAADSAALAAADVQSGRVPGDACSVASEVATAVAVAVASCVIDVGGAATVVVATDILGLAVTSTARAGPPSPQ